ncbi:hypothetical protein D4S03_04885 [bacterium]|nr:MAG: hypothetical protein D4S03_04885 [bacterium]
MAYPHQRASPLCYRGKGIVVTEEGEVLVTPGTFIFIPPGEKHWYGATEETKFSHISIQSPGKTILIK